MSALPPPAPVRVPSLGEEIANSVSHGLGLLLLAVGAPYLLITTSHRGGVRGVVGASVFLAGAMSLYLSSMLYHAFPRGRAKQVFRVLDHGSIFLLIAGTYTPFALGVLHGPWGWSLLGVVWTLAAVGIAMKAAGGFRYPRLSTAIYLVMGWLAVVVIRPLWLHLPRAGLWWLVAGGLCYTAGVAFYSARRMPYGHFVWHLFVLAGTACHCLAVVWASG